MIPLGVFWFIPLGYVIYLKFYGMGFYESEKVFVGLDNYRNLFQNPAFYQSLRVRPILSGQRDSHYRVWACACVAAQPEDEGKRHISDAALLALGDADRCGIDCMVLDL